MRPGVVHQGVKWLEGTQIDVFISTLAWRLFFRAFAPLVTVHSKTQARRFAGNSAS